MQSTLASVKIKNYCAVGRLMRATQADSSMW